MPCNCDCYCGCDTKANRLKFLAFGLCFTAYLGLRYYLHNGQRVCMDAFPEECEDYFPLPFKWSSVWHWINHPPDPSEHRHVPDKCIKAVGDVFSCSEEFVNTPTALALRLLYQIVFVAMFVPLGILCCCTKNPHKNDYVPVATQAPLLQEPPTSPPEAVTIPTKKS